MSLEAWLLFCATETVLCFTPGPAVLLVVSHALTRSARAGIGASGGVLAANAVYFALSGSGVAATLLVSSQLFFLIKWVGAAYLIWLGFRMLVAREAATPELQGASEDRFGVAAPGAGRALLHGFLTQGANPKTLVFFTALLPQFVDPTGSVPLQIGILGLSSIAIEFGVLSVYVLACRRARSYVDRPHWNAALNRGGGLLLIGAGAGLAAFRRS